jgi:hypothetical protein
LISKPARSLFPLLDFLADLPTQRFGASQP